MSAYEKSVSLGLTGTDAQKVATLKATGVTARPIKLDELLFLLNNRGMLVRLIRPADTGEKWAGTIVNMVLALNASGDPLQAAAVNQWFSHITNDRNNLFDTTQAAFSGPFWALSEALAGVPTMPSSADFEAVAALGGGWLFADLTVEQFAAQRATSEALQEQQALQSEWVAWLNETINPLIAAGNRSGLNAALAGKKF